jgi:hypothetical protein
MLKTIRPFKSDFYLFVNAYGSLSVVKQFSLTSGVMICSYNPFYS